MNLEKRVVIVGVYEGFAQEFLDVVADLTTCEIRDETFLWDLEEVIGENVNDLFRDKNCLEIVREVFSNDQNIFAFEERVYVVCESLYDKDRKQYYHNRDCIERLFINEI